MKLTTKLNILYWILTVLAAVTMFSLQLVASLKPVLVLPLSILLGLICLIQGNLIMYKSLRKERNKEEILKFLKLEDEEK